MKRLLPIIVLLLIALRGPLPAQESVSSGAVTLDGCLAIGLEMFEPLKLANEELELARLKRQEAYRALYPAVSVKAEATNGKTDDILVSPNFEERVYGASLGQSLYEGGRLFSTYKQAAASHEAAEKNREKVYQDFVYGVQEAFWKLVSAQEALAERELVLNLIKNDLKVMTEQYVLDLAVKQQFLAMKGQYLQANSQANGARLAFSKARWALAKAMGLPTPPAFTVSRDIPFKNLEPDLEHCRRLAVTHRPDLVMQDRLVEAARNGYTVAKAADRPKLLFNGFYGRSAAAYEFQSLNYRDDWQVNFRLTQAIFGNSIGATGNKINTSPKLGQSSRTNTETVGLNANVLDGLKGRTEIKQSDLALRQAQVKRDDLMKDVAMEVEESVSTLSQSALQVEFAEEDAKLADEEMAVAESKGKYGLSSTLELAQARNRRATARAARVDARAGYRVAVAALNRAVGVVDQFRVE